MQIRHLNKYFLLILFFFQSCSERNLSVIKNNDPITKVEMKVSSSDGMKKFMLVEPIVLDSLKIALRDAKKIDVQTGGAFEIWAEIKVYKRENVSNFFVLFSKYNGRYIRIDGRSLTCDYMFYLVKKYSDLIKS
jgi:hypothetical protein